MWEGQGGHLSWLQSREIGVQPPLGHRDRVSKMLYSSVDIQSFWDPTTASDKGSYGGIFNFDFATDGSVLVAACEGKSFLVFDPVNYRLINAREKAHNDCVNCVRFLDTRSFVTCSDDTSVILWDLRFLKNSVRSFLGHSNWVKNIEYASSLGLLVTSGFDGAVYTWNINNYSKEEECKRVFYIEGLMRCKLTPDDSKLVISTSRGYLLLVHDLDLARLDVDMDCYKAGLSVSNDSSACDFNTLFTRDRNRLEMVNDFPEDNKAEIVASLQVHPQGWCVVSRNTSADEATEWTCVHDIHSQAVDGSEEEQEEGEGLAADQGGFRAFHSSSSSRSPSPLHQGNSSARTDPLLARGIGTTAGSRFARSSRVGFRVASHRTVRPVQREDSVDLEEDGEGEHEVTTSPGDSAAETSSGDDFELFFNMGDSDVISSEEEEDGDEERGDTPRVPPVSRPRLNNNHWTLNRRARLRGRPHGRHSRRGLVTSDNSMYNYFMSTQRPRPFNGEFISLRSRSGSSVDMPSEATISGNLNGEQRQRAAHYISQRQERPSRHRMVDLDTLGSINFFYPAEVFNGRNSQSFKSKPRLIYAKQEPNVGRGFIKEQCFSTDGRLIVSPWGNGIRLLSFDKQCRELCDCDPPVARKSRSLHELREISMHPQVVLTTRFSPTHPLFVSGSRDGSIAFLTPCP
ncbi:DDB1- and CUL4-associated factor 10 homolog [Littorina saxatilis]|uniref:Uncharacterized protein n=1 Tax=Littorina saxatilis TaxID=31220 RepID=A0AAN9BQ22_9CAEN